MGYYSVKLSLICSFKDLCYSVDIVFREISWTPLELRAHLDKESGHHHGHERGDVVRQVVADDRHAALAVHLQGHLNTKGQDVRNQD